ncbi:MAG: hypothetical protein AB8H03_11705 [Saprospiraceae bacterium]
MSSNDSEESLDGERLRKSSYIFIHNFNIAVRLKLLLLFFIFPNLLFGQIQMSIDPIFSIEQSYRTLQSDNFLTLQTRNLKDKKRTGFRYGLNFNFYLGELFEEKIALKTGVRYLKTGYQSDLDSNFTIHNFLEIPLALRYYYGNRKIRPYSELGVGFLFNLNFDIDDFRNERLLHHSAFVAVGFDYNYSLDLAFFFQPIFRYHFTQTFSDIEVEEHLYNVGLETGFRMKF